MAADRKITKQDTDRAVRLRALRERIGITQDELAARANLKRRERIPKLEKGSDKFTSPDFIQSLATGYGVPLGRLVEYAAGKISLDEVLAPAPERTVEPEARYPEIEAIAQHLSARGEDPAVVAQFRAIATARHGNFTAADGPEILREARVRAKKLDDVFGDELPRMRRPSIDEEPPKGKMKR